MPVSSDDIALATQMMLWTDARHLPVVRDGEVVGVVSERDVVHSRQGGQRAAASVTIDEIMRSPALVVDADAALATAASLMFTHKLGCLPVLERGALVGMLTTTDLLRHDLDSALEGPAGTLPSAVRAIMKPAPAVVAPTSEVFDAAALMAARGIRHLPVVDGTHRVVGIVSDRDVRAAVGDPRRFLADPDARERVRGMTVAEVMSKPALTVQSEAPIDAAIERFVHDNVGAVPVVDADGKLVGMVSYLDVIHALRSR
jgi:CBS domain-containing protein